MDRYKEWKVQFYLQSLVAVNYGPAKRGKGRETIRKRRRIDPINPGNKRRAQ
jgi:hypothetical protein